MTDQPTPPQQPQFGPPTPAAPGPVPPTGADPHATVPGLTPEPPRRSRKGLVIGGSIAAGLLVLGGAGAAAYALLDGGGDQPEAALPAATAAYLRVDLDPSAQQKINLLRLADRLPDLSEDLGVEISEDSDLKKVLAEAITASGECEIDYDEQVAPWIGDRGALAAVPDADGEPQPVGVLAVTDESAARTAIESGLGCGETLDASQVAFTAGYVVVTDELAAADVVADAEESSLADSEAFTADMDALGDAGLVSFWADAEAIIDWSLASTPELTDGTLPDEYLDQLDGYTTMVGALRANPDGIELEFLSAGDEATLAPYRATGDSVTAALPETTLGAFSASVAPGAVDDAWEQFRELYDSMAALGGGLGGGTLMSSTGPGITAPTTVVDTDVDPMYDYCLDAAEDIYGVSGETATADEQALLDIFMEACTGVSTDESATATDDAATDELWADDTATDDLWADDSWGADPYGQPDFDGMIALLETEYDIRLPADLSTLFGEQIAVAVDSRGLDSLDTVQGIDDVSVGVRTVGDTDALQDLADRIDRLVVESGMDPLATSPADDGFVFATNDAYASELAGDGGLGSTDVYRSVVTAEDASSVLYVDLDQLTDVLRPVLESEPEALGYLEPFRAVAMTTSADDTHAKATFRVSFD
ncbi:hypothetical protein GCM10009718_19240 [Isoptericola halotolerans]|uniref:DUF3352 domain-containing protein n=1 Tax=Isoptericola halotolerans TaxID=300560 RepID=A0ABX2A9A1_9MICO|nr:hypothetical protein [Isoptericola halotolerans]NOV98492.1 hypothetical protein [Isoptericola halotolerans]